MLARLYARPMSPLRYAETVESGVRHCRLLDGPTAVCSLELWAFRQRFGAVAVPAEGIGGVETLPEYRRQGHIGRLLREALARMASRVPVAFVSNAIEGLYEPFGFVPALAEGHLEIPVRAAELTSESLPVREGTVDDLPAAVELYNAEHAERTWTHERPRYWNRLRPTETWRPGTRMLALDRDGALAGYAFLAARSFGDPLRRLTVDELTARDAPAARALLAAVASLCWELRISEFTVYEPLDGTVGRVAQRLGCSYHQDFPASGGMMAAILDRPALLGTLPASPAWEGLDDATLVRVLTGYAAADDAGPAGGLMPYAHRLDRY